VLGYKVDRSQKTITVQNFCCEHWRSVAVQTVSEAVIYHGAGFIKRAVAGVRVHEFSRIYLRSSFAKTVTSLLTLPSVLGVRCVS